MSYHKTEVAWCAGLFDGEGCVCFKSPSSKLPYLAISQQNREVLDRFRDGVKIGKVYGPYTRAGGKQVFQFVVSGHEKVQAIVAIMWSELGSVKKKQASAILLSYYIRARGRVEEGK